MDTVEIIIPISRSTHLARVFRALELLDCNPDTTSLLTYVDGNQELFEETDRRTAASKFHRRRCERGPDDGKPRPSLTDSHAARPRIAAIHNELRGLVGECKYVLGLEDDTIPPSLALTMLLRGYASYPFAGFIEGVELGRWGVPYVGAWRADSVYEPSSFESATPGQGIEEIDAGGFYCFLTKRELYAKHEFRSFDGNLFGPDVEYGMSLRREGYKNYVDWSVRCAHIRRDGVDLTLNNTTPYRVVFQKRIISKREVWKERFEPITDGGALPM